MVKYDEEFREREQRMNDTAIRIGKTPSGERFLDRMYEIGKPKPLHQEPEEEGE